ncbi:AfsR/SARP family transcriptional regulator [Streptomyces sp. NPDC001034]|uniref:AfsR/SARP family transcriptional regulator n=1 Tax=Streptomyces sp. NPDC001034 TaxID=3154375 RepID=UPI00332CA2E9
MGDSMRYGILGPLHVSSREAIHVPTAPKQRKLLSLLLLNAGRMVPVSDCVEELWGYSPPSSAVPTLQTYVMQLRRLLKEGADPRLPAAERLVTRDRGYELVMEEDELDRLVFRKLRARGLAALDAGDDCAASRLLGEALALWRGPALSDVQHGPLLAVQTTGMNECRLQVTQQRIEADLRLGRHHDLISELSVLTGAHPVNENLYYLFMVALYQVGRKVDALGVYHQLRRILSDELGLGPSPQIGRLHELLLADKFELNRAGRLSVR